jgi:TPR repeat protein
MAMTVKRRRGGVPLTKTQKRIIAGTAAVAATVGGLYALYRKRKSLKAVMKPRVQKLTPEQRETFVKESHKRKLPGKTADDVVERADEAVREARRAAATRQKRQAKRGRTRKRARRKRSSSGIGYVGGTVSVIVLGVAAAYAVAAKSGVTKSGVGEGDAQGESTSHGEPKSLEAYATKAEQGDAHAQTKLADMYYSGEGVKKNLKKAAELYTKAAEQGNVKAQTKLADMYYSGEGVKKNLTEAAKWYTKVSEHGPVGQHSDALLLIGKKKHNTNCNRRWIDVGGGGDCLFRCLAYLQYGNPNKHFDVRTELCNYTDGHIFPYAILSNSEMRKQGEWGDSNMIYRASEKYKKKIIVCSDDTHEVDNFGNNTFLQSSTVPPSADKWYIKNQGVGRGEAGVHYIVSKS